MTLPERPEVAALGEALHRETWLSHGLPPEAICGLCKNTARKLVAQGYVRAAAAEPLRGAFDGLRALSRAASKGPWTLGRSSEDNEKWWPQVWPAHGAPVASFDGRPSGRPGAPEKDAADAAFIVEAVNFVRAALATAPSTPEPALDAAWAEAEAALPAGWDLMVGHTSECSYCDGWWATASHRPTDGPPPHYPRIISSETGRPRGEHHDSTPAAALRALVRHLTAVLTSEPRAAAPQEEQVIVEDQERPLIWFGGERDK